MISVVVARRILAFGGGLLVGLLGVAFGLWTWFTLGREQLAEDVLGRLDLPAEVLEIERVSWDGTVRVALADVALLSPAGDTIAAVPRLQLVLRPAALAGEAAIEIPELTLRDPYLNLVQSPSGGWNFSQALRVEAGGREVQVPEQEGGRAILIRDVRVIDGHVRLATPFEPEPDSPPASREALRLARIGGQPYRIRTVADLDARLPRVRVGGAQGWRVEVTALNARLADPDLRITELEGTIEQARDGGVRFALDVLRTGESLLEGAGVVRLGGDTPSFDVTLTAAPLDFGDLRWVLPTLPADGRARGIVALESRAGGRIAVTARDLAVTAFESRLAGRVSALFGGGQPAVFRDTELQLDPLRLSVFEQLGLVDSLPLEGAIRGTLASIADEAAAGALRLDLVATAFPQGQPADSSVVFLQGPVALAPGEEAPVRFAGLRVLLQPLRLDLLRPFAPEALRERLAGTLHGDFVLNGTPSELRIPAGELALDVGEAPPIRLGEIALDLALDPLRFELSAEAQPLELAALSEIFPALPFRNATFAGPIRLAGRPDSVRVGADLRSGLGGIDLQGDFFPGDPLRFDVTARLQDLRPSALLVGSTPVQGVVSGTVEAAGSLEDFALDTNLTQGDGALALNARVRRPGGETQIETTGQLTDFRLGALIGRPGLFSAPLSGNLQLTGGGRQPYLFDVNLAGPTAGLDLSGRFVPGEIPEYVLSGTVAGLNAGLLPGATFLPRTNLTAAVELEGSGATLETLTGQLRFATRPPATVAGAPLDARIRARVSGGVLVVDTLVASVASSRLSAEGSWGLTRPVEGPLRYTLSAPDLGVFAPLLPPVEGIEPRVDGSIAAEGWLAGSLRQPVVTTRLRGRGLRYEEWRTRDVAINLDASLLGEGWRGEAGVTADAVVLGGGEDFETIRFRAAGTADRLAIDAFVRRDAEADLAIAGALDFVGEQQIRAVDLETLALRVGATRWQLASGARLQWGGVDGIAINNLLLRRVGDAAVYIQVDGLLPPRGNADLRLQARGLNVGPLLGLVQPEPIFGGILAADVLIQGPVADPEASIALRVDSLQLRGAAAEVAYIDARYAAGTLTVDSVAIWANGQRALTANATVPATLSLEDLIPNLQIQGAGALRAQIIADSLPAGILTAAVPQFRDGAGIIDGRITVAGTPDAPRLAGDLAVLDGAVDIVPLGTRYRDIRGRFSLDGNTVRVDSLTLRNQGAAVVAGTIRFTQEAPEVYLTGVLDNFQAIDREGIADVEASGQVALSGQFPTPTLTGQLTLTDGTITIPGLDAERADLELELTNVDIGAIGADTVARAAAEPTLIQKVRIEGLEVAIGDGVWLVSEDARVQIDGDLAVTRAGTELRIFGGLQALRGTYALRIGPLVREFDVVSGTVEFFGTPDFNPALEITAANEILTSGGGTDAQLTILVRITGTLQFPRITLTTDTQPPLPESDILSYLIFGQPSFQLGDVGGAFAQDLLVQEAFGGVLATGIERLLEGTGLGFDYVRVRGRPDLTPGRRGTRTELLGSTTVEFGKQIADDVFWTLETGVGSIFSESERLTAGTSIQWQIDREWAWRFALEPIRSGTLLRFQTTADRYQFSTDLRRRWEYGRPREDTLLLEEAPRLPGQLTDPPAPEVIPPDSGSE